MMFARLMLSTLGRGGRGGGAALVRWACGPACGVGRSGADWPSDGATSRVFDARCRYLRPLRPLAARPARRSFLCAAQQQTFLYSTCNWFNITITFTIYIKNVSYVKVWREIRQINIVLLVTPGSCSVSKATIDIFVKLEICYYDLR